MSLLRSTKTMPDGADFRGNTDSNTVVFSPFGDGGKALRGLRIKPKTWNTHPSMRANPVITVVSGDSTTSALDSTTSSSSIATTGRTSVT